MLIKAGLGKYRPQQQRQVVFSSLKLDRLRAMFKEMITTSVPISKPNVKEIFQKEDGGKGTLTKSLITNNNESCEIRKPHQKSI